ncbi:DUF983 domain-containing protein [Henriciella sp. AS95]|uniref:DUF983 domain-containing protein n=1 Tax=Henriciella sp. AS95 TaxID=3135782 RepID=UPI00316E073F
MANSNEQTSIATALVRGIRKRCPRCGEGQLFSGYLRQTPSCSSCGLKTGDIRADDGPPWLTLLIVGHFLAPLMAITFMTDALPLWLSTAGMVIFAIGLCLTVLPRAKGAFIAAIWKLDAQNSVDITEEA